MVAAIRWFGPVPADPDDDGGKGDRKKDEPGDQPDEAPETPTDEPPPTPVKEPPPESEPRRPYVV